jgi:hypothetical protein
MECEVSSLVKKNSDLKICFMDPAVLAPLVPKQSSNCDKGAANGLRYGAT